MPSSTWFQAVVSLGLVWGLVMAPAIRVGSGPSVVLLYERAKRDMAPVLPLPGIREMPLEGFQNPGLQADTVILGGHSSPPIYVGQPSDAVAKAIVSFKPEVVILETCYGASTPLMDALAAKGYQGWVVAAPYQLPIRNLQYGPAFFSARDPLARVMAVQTVPPYPLLRWQLDPRPLAELHAKVDAMSSAELYARLKRANPALIKMPFPTKAEPKARILVDVPVERFKRPAKPAS